MTNKHVNDIDIQQYVLLRDNCDENIIEHIEHCEHCKSKAAQYKFLFEEINRQDKPAFDFNLAALVMKQIPEPKTAASAENSFIYFIALMVIVLVFVSGYLLRNIFWNSFPGIAPILTYLIITAAASLLIFQGFDMYRKYELQMKALNFY
jgi:hypothetical protein